MAKAKKLPSGNFRCQACRTVNGKKTVKSFTAPTKKEAEYLAAEWQFKYENTSNLNDMTLKSACDRYILLRTNTVSPVTLSTYKSYQKRYLTELQTLKVKSITKNALQSVFNELSADLSPKTIKSVYGFFSAVIKDATGETIEINLPKQYKRIYNTPDSELSKRILSLSKGTELEIPIALALRCGLRISEVCGLKWQNITPTYIVIDNVIVSYGTEQFEKKPKSSAGNRKVPITSDIFELFSSAPRNTEYVVNKNAKAIGAQFRRFLKSNNLPPMRFHDLRHGFASAMAVMGIPEAYAMAIGGWETPDILHSIYEQTFEKQKEEFNLKTQNYFR